MIFCEFSVIYDFLLIYKISSSSPKMPKLIKLAVLSTCHNFFSLFITVIAHRQSAGCVVRGPTKRAVANREMIKIITSDDENYNILYKLVYTTNFLVLSLFGFLVVLDQYILQCKVKVEIYESENRVYTRHP